MTIKPSENRKQSSPVIEVETYRKIPAGQLMLSAVRHAQSKESLLSLEDLISACFLLFPQAFGLKKFPQWPDSALVSKLWNEGKQQGLIQGDLESGFALTPSGIKRATETAAQLGLAPQTHPKRVYQKKARPIWEEPSAPPNPFPARKDATRKNTKADVVDVPSPTLAKKFIKVMEKSDAYSLYRKNGKRNTINEFDFRSLLLCTMESSGETMVHNLNLYKQYAASQNRNDLISFLDYCKESFSYLLSERTSRKKAKNRF